MKQLWQKLQHSVDGRSTRERVMIFATAIVVVGALMQSLFLDPVIAERNRLVRGISNDQAEIVKLVAQVQAAVRAKGEDPDVALKAKLKELEQRQAELQRQIEAQSAELVPPAKMAAVLEKILASNPRLQLIEVKTLPRTSLRLVREPASPEAGRSPEAKPEAPEEKKPGEVYRHGVEVTMRGSYLDLLGYLREIESLPVRMFWDSLKISVAVYPTVTMKLTVYTISLERVWLTV